MVIAKYIYRGNGNNLGEGGNMRMTVEFDIQDLYSGNSLFVFLYYMVKLIKCTL